MMERIFQFIDMAELVGLVLFLVLFPVMLFVLGLYFQVCPRLIAWIKNHARR